MYAYATGGPFGLEDMVTTSGPGLTLLYHLFIPLFWCNPFSPLVPPHVPPFQVFGVGLALGLWLYSGYEQVSSVAEEVQNPQRNYPIALTIVVPLSIATYFLPTMFSLAALGDWQKWHTG